MAFSFDPVWYRDRFALHDFSDSMLAQFYETEGKAQHHPSCYEEESALYASLTLQKGIEDLWHLDRVRERIRVYQEEHARFLEQAMPDTVIFSAVTKSYDSLKIPHVLDPSCEYVVFTDEPIAETGVWKIQPIPYWNRDPTRETRYVKLHPHWLFPWARLAIWIDQNVILFDGLQEERAAFLASQCPIATFYHPTRKEVAEEVAACMHLHKEKKEVLLDQLVRYQNKGSGSQGIANTNVMFFNLTHPQLPAILGRWWAELDRYSKRDQVSFSYCVEQEHASWFPLAGRGICATNHPKFGMVHHDKNHGLYADMLACLRTQLTDPLTHPSALPERGAMEECLASCLVIVYLPKREEAYPLDTEAFLGLRRLCCINGGGAAEAATAKLKALHPDCFVVEQKEDLGFAASLNSVIARCDASLYVCIHGGCCVDAHWMECLATALLATPGAGLVVPLGNTLLGLRDQTASQDFVHSINEALGAWVPSGMYPRVPLAQGQVFGISRKAVRALQAFSEAFSTQDDVLADACLRASVCGFDTVLATNVYVGDPKDTEPSKHTSLHAVHGAERVVRGEKTLLYHPLLLSLRKKLLILHNACCA
ncbi:MAG: DUF616 domain-containing protein [Desulfovibrio sp.]|nr:DUF616 domain-containing protein [Desulfovibrio sp.]